MTCECRPMPLTAFDAEARAAIEEAVQRPKPPPQWKRVAFGWIVSRAWMEWHRERGRCPACKPRRPSIPEWMRQAVLARDGWTCGLCEGTINGRADLHIDHIKPWAHGGPTSLNNLQPAHAACNIRKGAKIPGATA